MTSKDIIYEMQLQIFEVIKSQEPELFDVVFEVEGKKLYADKFRLSGLSSTFNSMLSDRWTSKNDAIKIEAYTFEDFKEFLTFLYCGECKLTYGNVMVMLDIAEFYQVNSLKNFCDEYLSKMEYKMDNVFQLLEISIKYSLIQLKKGLIGFISQNFTSCLKSDGFLNVEKSSILEIVKMETDVQPEELFLAVYEWAEKQAIKKQKETNDENLNMTDAIKAEMSDILPYIEFKKMGLSFLHEHVVKRGFLFTYDDLSDILKFVHSVKVKITNLKGQSMCGSLPHGNDAINIIKSLKNRKSDNGEFCNIYWVTRCKIPSNPSPLKQRDGIKWYLMYFSDGDIGVADFTSLYEDDYLLAEMHSETDFDSTDECKIEIE